MNTSKHWHFLAQIIQYPAAATSQAWILSHISIHCLSFLRLSVKNTAISFSLFVSLLCLESINSKCSSSVLKCSLDVEKTLLRQTSEDISEIMRKPEKYEVSVTCNLNQLIVLAKISWVNVKISLSHQSTLVVKAISQEKMVAGPNWLIVKSQLVSAGKENRKKKQQREMKAYKFISRQTGHHWPWTKGRESYKTRSLSVKTPSYSAFSVPLNTTPGN